MSIRIYARSLGRRGGRARAKALSSERRATIARMGGKTRALSRHVLRRIERNFHGWNAVKGLRGTQEVRSVSTAKETLPGIYGQADRLP